MATRQRRHVLSMPPKAIDTVWKLKKYTFILDIFLECYLRKLLGLLKRQHYCIVVVVGLLGLTDGYKA
jgi:hypothetical protein